MQSSVGLYNLILELSVLNLRWENYQFNSKNIRDPFEVADELVSDTLSRLKMVNDLVKFSNSAQLESRAKKDLESNHQEIFQHLWIQFDTNDYEKRIQDYVNRLEVNQLGKDFMKNKKVLDLGCGWCWHWRNINKIRPDIKIVGIDFVKEKIFSNQSKILNYFDRENMQNLIDQHFKGTQNKRLLIWSLISFEHYLNTM